MIKIIKYRWLLFVLIILGLFAAIFISATMENKIDAAGSESPTGPVWIATNVEFDSLRVQNELLKYAVGQSDAAAVNLIVPSRMITLTLAVGPFLRQDGF